MRYQQLINSILEKETTIRELSAKLGLSATAIYNYANTNVEPKLWALKKMSEAFGEPISVLLSEDDNLTAELITQVRLLSPKDKECLLEALKNR